ncbi:MAG: hypothetical protein LBT54_03970 [Bifidobacteriaceae bacterium]|jgi:hypothetical protein|nr:hypothetical protein [Bifidobacteriaceae bacterium]
MKFKAVTACAVAPILAGLGLAGPAGAAPADSGPRQLELYCTVSPTIKGATAVGVREFDIAKGKKAKITVKVSPKACNGTFTVKQGKKTLKKLNLKKGKGTLTLPAKSVTAKAGKHALTFTYNRPGVRKTIKTKATLWVSNVASFKAAPATVTLYQRNSIPVAVAADYRGKLSYPRLYWGTSANPQSGSWDELTTVTGNEKKGVYKATAIQWLSSYGATWLGSVGTHRVNITFFPVMAAAKPAAKTAITVVVKSNELAVGTDIAAGDYRFTPVPERTCFVNTEGATRSYQSWTITGNPGTVTVLPDDTKLAFSGCSGGPVKL